MHEGGLGHKVVSMKPPGTLATISPGRHNQIPLVSASCPENQWGQRFGGGTPDRVDTAAWGGSRTEVWRWEEACPLKSLEPWRVCLPHGLTPCTDKVPGG